MDKIKMTTPLVEMDGDEMTRIPVSYTHLDVYKRQALTPLRRSLLPVSDSGSGTIHTK